MFIALFVFRVPELEFKPFKELFHPELATRQKIQIVKKLQGSLSAACRAFKSALVKEDKHKR